MCRGGACPWDTAGRRRRRRRRRDRGTVRRPWSRARLSWLDLLIGAIMLLLIRPGWPVSDYVWSAIVNVGATGCFDAASDLQREARLAARGRPRALRVSGPRDRATHARRALHRPQADGPGVAGARGPDLPHRRRRGTAGGGPQRVEPLEPARALLGLAHAPAPPGAPHRLRPAVVVPAVSPADADDDRGQRPVRARRRRRRLPRLA